MRRRTFCQTDAIEAELIGAALRYVAVADWFERRPITLAERARDGEAMDAFNRIEAKLRHAGRRALRRLGHRDLVLEQAIGNLRHTEGDVL